MCIRDSPYPVGGAGRTPVRREAGSPAGRSACTSPRIPQDRRVAAARRRHRRTLRRSQGRTRAARQAYSRQRSLDRGDGQAVRLAAGNQGRAFRGGAGVNDARLVSVVAWNSATYYPDLMPVSRRAFLGAVPAALAAQPAAPAGINRRDIVSRHNPTLRALDPRSPLSVGNGEFAFTADLTGLQTFPQPYDCLLYTSPSPRD